MRVVGVGGGLREWLKRVAAQRIPDRVCTLHWLIVKIGGDNNYTWFPKRIYKIGNPTEVCQTFAALFRLNTFLHNFRHTKLSIRLFPSICLCLKMLFNIFLKEQRYTFFYILFVKYLLYIESYFKYTDIFSYFFL